MPCRFVGTGKRHNQDSDEHWATASIASIDQQNWSKYTKLHNSATRGTILPNPQIYYVNHAQEGRLSAMRETVKKHVQSLFNLFTMVI
jgi:hypothetical protein